jgi:hypothetical protein
LDLLDTAHVFANGAANVETGGSGQNAFFVHRPGDRVLNFKPGDVDRLHLNPDHDPPPGERGCVSAPSE